MNKKNSQLKNDIPKDYNLEWKEEDTIYIAPIVLSKDSDVYADKEEEIYQKIRAYYNADSTVVGTIMSCLSEVGSNFIRHAEESTNSVMVARGNKDFFELACADTGIGTITSLRPVLNGKYQVHEVLRKALEPGVTSKPGTNHSGSGLWLISKYVSFSKGDLFLFSEGAFCHQKKSNFKMGQCGKWKGTIIYVIIPLYNKDALAAGKRELSKQYSHVKLTLI
ncbi:MAG: HAMP domain-containing histidine kinase [Bacteroidales bacterium]|nr:HAMP domain-containing histidine kinase [Bacteroidales bacterium]